LKLPLNYIKIIKKNKKKIKENEFF